MSNAAVKQINGRDIEPERVKAWANLNGTGTIALRDSLNITSVTDNGIGNYSLTFTNPFAADSYNAPCSSDIEARMSSGTNRTVGSIQLRVYTHDGAAGDTGVDISSCGGLA